jgi:hypothetical protein
VALLHSRAAKRLSKLLRITRLLAISFDRKDSGLSGRFSVVGNLLPRIGEGTIVGSPAVYEERRKSTLTEALPLLRLVELR